MNDWIKFFVLLLLGFAVVLVLFLSGNLPVRAVAPEKLNICHLTHSDGNPWVAQQINANELQSHLDNGDFLYNGPLKQNGHPENANHQDSDWCFTNAPHHFSCIENACTRVEGTGQSSCESNSQCELKPSHTACIQNSCVFVEGPGENECSIESECVTPPVVTQPGDNKSDVPSDPGATQAHQNVCNGELPVTPVLDVFSSDAKGNRTLHWHNFTNNITKQAITFGYDKNNLNMGVDNIPASSTEFTLQGTDPNRMMWARVWIWNGECANTSAVVDK